MVRLAESALRLSGNQLKIIALIAMTCDHVGMMFFPDVLFLRLIGRISMPIFAWMIAEGCRYTRSRSRYLLGIALLALVCQCVNWIATQSLFQCILVTFSLSIVLIFLLDNAREKPWGLWAFFGALACVLFLTEVLPRLPTQTDFDIDYGFCGIALPVLFYIGKNKKQSLLLGALGLAALSLTMGPAQWFCLLSLPLLALYSGRRGKWRLKYLFYIYYPAHLAVIYLLWFLI